MTALHVVTAGLPVDLAGRWQKDAEDFLIKRLSRVSCQAPQTLRRSW